MKFILSYLLISIFSIVASPQVDYQEYKSRYDLSCSIPDSAEVFKTKARLDSIQAVGVSNGEEDFLLDYGWAYYMSFLTTEDTAFLAESAKSYEVALQKFENNYVLYQLAFIYKALGKCKKSCSLLTRYIESTEIELEHDERMEQQIKLIEKACCDN